jgi:hypothetical protein
MPCTPHCAKRAKRTAAWKRHHLRQDPADLTAPDVLARGDAVFVGRRGPSWKPASAFFPPVRPAPDEDNAVIDHLRDKGFGVELIRSMPRLWRVEE